jgi:hypothetical protein
VVLAALVVNVAFALAQELAELEQGLLRQDDLHFLAGLDEGLILGVTLHRDERQAVPIRRHQAHRVGAQDEQGAVEEVAGVLSGNRKLCPRHHLAKRITRERRAAGAGRLRKRRKIFARQRLHPGVEAIGRHLDAVLVFLDADVGFRQRLQDFVELLRRQR